MAANGLKSAVLMRVGKPEKVVTLLLLFVLLTAAAAGVTSVLTGPDWGSLWRGLTFGLLLGWALALTRQPALRSALITALLAGLYGLLYAGGLRQELGSVLTELGFITSRLISYPRAPGIDFTPLVDRLGEAINTIAVIVERVHAWVLALAGGEPAFDPVAAAFVWVVLVWIVAAWAGWVAAARRNALSAVLPALLLSVGALSYGRRESFTIYLMLGSTLLLLATIQHDRREQEWDKVNTAYPPRKGRQVGNVAFIASTGLVLLAAIASSISIPRLLEWASASSGPAAEGEGGLAESLGIVSAVTATPDVFEDVRLPGLPRDRLIGSGPELSKRIVMTVAVEDFLSIFKAGQPHPLYWRSFTYDTYTGHGWRTSDTSLSQYQANQPLQPEQAPQRISIVQIVRPVAGQGSFVYAAGEPVAVNNPSQAAWRSPKDLFGILSSSANSYATRSLVSVADERTLRAEGQKYPDWVRQRYLSIPSDVPGRVKELALQLTAAEPTPYDRVKAIEQYLRTIPYTLDVPYPPLDQDLVDFFLFDLNKGYCDFYASAMVVLARAAGVPARLAVGYAGGNYDLNARRFLVSEADAHSWVEVYFPGAEWVPFEPTAGRPALEKSGNDAPEMASSVTIPAGTPSPDRIDHLPPGWMLLLVLGGSLAVIGAAWVAYGEIRLQRLPEPAAAIEVYQRMRRFGEYLGVTSEPGDTPFEYASSLRSRIDELSQIWVPPRFEPRVFEEIAAITDRIVEVSYRPSESENTTNQLIVHPWRKLRWQLGLMRLTSSYQSLRARLWAPLVDETSGARAAIKPAG